MWLDKSGKQLQHDYPATIRVLKIEGSGDDLIFSVKQGANNFYSKKIYNYTSRISGDTLYLKTKGETEFSISNRGTLNKIIIEKAHGFIHDERNTGISSFEIGNSSRMRLFTKLDTTAAKQLQLQVRDESVLQLNNGKISTITATVNNGEIILGSKLMTDTANIRLEGRSTVRSDMPGNMQEVKNLIVSGNRQYFKEKNMGKGMTIRMTQ